MHVPKATQSCVQLAVKMQEASVCAYIPCPIHSQWPWCVVIWLLPCSQSENAPLPCAKGENTVLQVCTHRLPRTPSIVPCARCVHSPMHDTTVPRCVHIRISSRRHLVPSFPPSCPPLRGAGAGKEFLKGEYSLPLLSKNANSWKGRPDIPLTSLGYNEREQGRPSLLSFH